MIENHCLFKMRGKLFSLTLLYTSLTTFLLFFYFSYISSFLHWIKQRKTNFGIAFFIVNCFPWKSFYTKNVLRPTKRNHNVLYAMKIWRRGEKLHGWASYKDPGPPDGFLQEFLHRFSRFRPSVWILPVCRNTVFHGTLFGSICFAFVCEVLWVYELHIKSFYSLHPII